MGELKLFPDKLTINLYPDKKDILLKPTVPIDLELLEEFEPFIRAMANFVKNSEDAIGLAANQVWEHKDIPCPRIFVMGRIDIEDPLVCINPSVEFTGKTLKHQESCLSRPGKLYWAKRSKNCTIHYYDLEGLEHLEKYTGIYAQIIGHEMQHLYGDILKRVVKDPR
jgi:peptide deformylase